MEHFRNAKVVRLRSRHNKYLTADDDDDDGVRQHRNGASREAKWEVQLVEGRNDVIRLKSCCYNRYLAASDKRFLLGATGKKVLLQQLPARAQPQSLGESVEWQPVRDGSSCIKLRTKAGTFLRANGFIKPYGNTVTHGNPHRTATQDWVLWEVDVIEMSPDAELDSEPSAAVANSVLASSSLSSSYPARFEPVPSMKDRGQAAGFSAAKILLAAVDSITSSRSRKSTKSDVSMASSCVSDDVEIESPYTASRRSTSVDSPATPPTIRLASSSLNTRPAPVPDEMQSSDDDTSSSTASTPPPSPPRPRPRIPNPTPVLSRKESSSHQGRLITYHFADDDGEIDDSFESGSFNFYGSNPQDLIQSVEKETGVDEFILCRRNARNNRLYRIRTNLSLPPDREPMTVYIVHPMSQVASQI